MIQLDIKANRNSKKYTNLEQLKRIAWMCASFLFRFSPRIFFGWRNFLLRLFGAKIGEHVHIYNSCKIYMPWNLEVGNWSAIGEEVLIYNLGHVCIGSSVAISHRAHLCAGTHDHNKKDLPLLKPPILIKDQSWICTSSFIGPGVTINQGAVIGACAVVMKDVDSWSIVAGNPAKFINKRRLE